MKTFGQDLYELEANEISWRNLTTQERAKFEIRALREARKANPNGFSEEDHKKYEQINDFLTPDQIAADLVKIMDPYEITQLKEFEEKKLISLHHGFGTAIRNEYLLWHPNNPHTLKNHTPEVTDGVDYSPLHPDDVSMRVIEKLHKLVQ